MFLLDHYACKIGQLWFPRKRNLGTEVFRALQAL